MRTLHFLFTIFCETPIVLFSIRCISILNRPQYIKHAFCRIFIASMRTNAIVFFCFLILYRIPGIGYAYSFYSSISHSALKLIALFSKTLFHTSFMLSFLQSVNRASNLAFNKEFNAMIWGRFNNLILPGCITFTALLNIRLLSSGAEYVKDKDNTTFYLKDNQPSELYGIYWIIIEGFLDLLCNVYVMRRYVNFRSRVNADSCFENSMYLIVSTRQCRCSQFFLCSALSLLLISSTIDGDSRAFVHIMSNMALETAILLPTVFIIIFTRDVRYEARKTALACATAML